MGGLRINADRLKPYLLKKKAEKFHTVLLVDDEEENLFTLKSTLSPYYHVFTAQDGKEALEFLKNNPQSKKIDLIISDQRMPVMKGVDFLEKSIPLLPNATRMIFTGFTDVNSILDSINRANIHKFIMKPFDQRDLLLTVQRALEAQELATHNLQLMDDLKELNSNLEHKVQERTDELKQSHQALEEKNKELVEKENEYREDLNLAAKVQSSLFLGITPPSYLQLEMKNIPYSQVTGDIYHTVHRADGAFDVFVGDAIGHGVSAGFLTILAHQALVRIPESWTLSEIMCHLNEFLLANTPEELFMTGTYLRIYPDGRLIQAAAGHPPALILSPDGSTVKLDVLSPFLGMFREFEHGELEYQLSAGDKLFLYSDGCFELLVDGEVVADHKQFLSFLEQDPGRSLSKIVQELDDHWAVHSGAKQFKDDVTFIALEFQGVI